MTCSSKESYPINMIELPRCNFPCTVCGPWYPAHEAVLLALIFTCLGSIGKQLLQIGLIGVTRPTLFTLPTLHNFFFKFTFFLCGACLRRWISPLVPTLYFQSFSNIQPEISSQKVAFKKQKTKIPTYLPTLFFIFYVTPIKQFLF